MNEVKISQLNQTNTIYSNDLLILNQNGATKAVKASTLLESVLAESENYVTKDGEIITSIKERLSDIEGALRSAGLL